MIAALLERFQVAPVVARAAERAAPWLESKTRAPLRARLEARVLGAFFDEGIDESDLAGAYGYGYDDAGRRRYEALLSRIFGTQRALARLSLVSGTAAIVATLSACLPHNGRLLVASGRPYDTLRNALADAPYSLVERGIIYQELRLDQQGGIDRAALTRACGEAPDVVFLQRSRGYAPRRSFSAGECGEIARAVKEAAPAALVLVDNCYGELVEEFEPTHYGADAVIGSLIKNLGGGLAPGGAYVAGTETVIERVAAYHYAPGLGDALGPNLGFARSLVQGLFYAPLVVGETLAGLDFAAALFAELGFGVDPAPGDERRDIVQAIRLGDPSTLLAFARGLQRAMPLNARFAPEPGPVPGYADPVVMSAGAFAQGATIELSCDAPLRPPFEAYLQGGISRAHAALGALLAADAVIGSLSKESKVP